MFLEPGWNFPYEHTREFVPVTEPARLPGSYEDTLQIDLDITELSIVLEWNANSQTQLNLYEEYRHEGVRIRRIETI